MATNRRQRRVPRRPKAELTGIAVWVMLTGFDYFHDFDGPDGAAALEELRRQYGDKLEAMRPEKMRIEDCERMAAELLALHER